MRPSQQALSSFSHHLKQSKVVVSRCLKRGLLFVLGAIFSMGVSAKALYPLETEKQSIQFNHLLKDLRCLVCQNQDLADSNADLANDLRRQVYEMVKAGQSDSEIIHYLTERYGDFILFKPPVKMITTFLWFGPGLFLGLGLFIFWRSCLRPERRNGHE